MAVSHVKTNTIADWAVGTVTVNNSTGGTNTVNATDLVRPSDWNSAHNQYVTISGAATAGTANGSGTNLVFGGSNSLTLNLSTDVGGGQTLWFQPTVASVSGISGLSHVVNGSTTSVYELPQSYWELFSPITGTAYSSHDPATSYVQPMIIQEPLAFKAAYCMKSVSVGMPIGQTSATNQSFTMSYKHEIRIFSRRDYANNSKSLSHVYSGTWGCTFLISQASANLSCVVNYLTDTAGGTTSTSNTTVSANSATLASYFNGPRWVRIPLTATTLPAGEYFVVQGHSSTQNSVAGTSTRGMNISNLHMVPAVLGAAQYFGSTNATSSHVGVRGPLFEGVVSAVTTNADMNATAISVGTVNNWYLAFGNM